MPDKNLKEQKNKCNNKEHINKKWDISGAKTFNVKRGAFLNP